MTSMSAQSEGRSEQSGFGKFTRSPVSWLSSGCVNRLEGNGPAEGLSRPKRGWTLAAVADVRGTEVIIRTTRTAHVSNLTIARLPGKRLWVRRHGEAPSGGSLDCSALTSHGNRWALTSDHFPDIRSSPWRPATATWGHETNSVVLMLPSPPAHASPRRLSPSFRDSCVWRLKAVPLGSQWFTKCSYPPRLVSHGGSMRLTVRDRVLLYLLENPVDSDTPTVPAALIQEAIAEQAGFPHRHFSILVRPLVRDGLVREWMAHVRYHRQRRKVYALTESGRLAARRLWENLEKELVPVRMGSEVREAPISALLDMPKGISLLRVVRLVLRNGIVDPALLTPAHAFVEMLADAPRPQRFVGRDAELDVILKGEQAAPIFVVRGIPGIGKTWFAAKACEELRGRRNLFWHRVRPWDTLQSILSRLGEFLRALDRPGLRSVLSQSGTNRAAEVLQADLPGTCAFLVFDDAHEASPDAMQFFRLLTDSIPRRWDSQALILTRRSLPFYDRRDVVLRGMVREIDLGGPETQ